MVRNLLDWGISGVLQHILKYREDVIRRNLTSAFPLEKPETIRELISANYDYLSKVFRQILVKPSKSLLDNRLSLNNPEILDHWLQAEKSIILVFGHIGNWEWAGSFIGLKYPDQVCALYKKIKSSFVNKLMFSRRLTHVNYLVEISQISELLKLIKKKPVIIEMISDQNPGSDQGLIWVNFFGRDTAFVNGPENLAIRYQLPVVYLHIQSLPTGKYELTCVNVFDGKEKTETGEITQRFASLMEENIRQNNAEWLWSHRRWKRKK